MMLPLQLLFPGLNNLLKYAKSHRASQAGFTHFNKYHDDDELILN